MITITTTGLGVTLLMISVLLPIPLAILANNRDRRPVPWALLGAIPLVNIVCLILLLWTPLPSETEEDEAWEALEAGHDQSDRPASKVQWPETGSNDSTPGDKT